MKMTEELAVKIFNYIEKNQKLFKDSLFLYNYVYQGFKNIKGDSVGNNIYHLNGGAGVCQTEIFVDEIQMYYGESEEELVERLSKYAISYLTCVAALDMFVNKFTNQYFDVQHLTRLTSSNHALNNNKVEFLLDDQDGGLIIEDVYFTIESDDYKLVNSPLDLKLKVEVQRFDREDFGQGYIKVSELNKSRLEEMMLAAGW